MVFVPYRGIPNLNLINNSKRDCNFRVFVPYRGIPNLNFSCTILSWFRFQFSSPTGAFLISISNSRTNGKEKGVFVPYRGIPNLNLTPM